MNDPILIGPKGLSGSNRAGFVFQRVALILIFQFFGFDYLRTSPKLHGRPLA